MKLIKVIDKSKLIKGKNGKTFASYYYALELDNGRKIVIKPSFSDDYAKMDLISEVQIKNA